jgi:hypothetical protein
MRLLKLKDDGEFNEVDYLVQRRDRLIFIQGLDS